MTISTEDADLAQLACGITAGSVPELLALRACTTPGRPAFSSAGAGRELTYGALAALSGQWTAALRSARLPLEARIGLRRLVERQLTAPSLGMLETHALVS